MRKTIVEPSVEPVTPVKEGPLFNKKDLFAYFFVAATGALVQLIVGSLLHEWFLVSYKRAILIGYVVAFFVGFFLTKLFAFDARKSAETTREAVKFCMVSVVSGFITVYLSAFMYDYSVQQIGIYQFLIPNSTKEVDVNKLVSHVGGMGLSFISNYILHKTFTFRNTGFYEKLKWLLNLR